MQNRKHIWLLAALFAVLPVAELFQAAHPLHAAASSAAQADKRKPGLYMTFQTDKGNIACKLYETEAPVTVHTMVGLPLGNGTGHPGGPGFPYKNEVVSSLKFDTPGRLAMANAGPNTNGSQFFITEALQPALNGGYTIWAECSNLDVVKAIARVKRDSSDRPATPVHIQHVIVERVGPAPADAPEAMPPANPPN